MHEISFVYIENFRACKKVCLPLGAYTPLVGQNNTGKSAILEAIRWVLRPSALNTTDFNDPKVPVIVALMIKGITGDLLSQIPDVKHRTAISPYCKDGVLWIRVCASIGSKSLVKEVWAVDAYQGDGVPTDWRSYPTGLPEAVSVLLPDPLFIEAMDDVSEDLGKAKAGTTIKYLLDEIMVPVLTANQELASALESIQRVLGTDSSTRSTQLKDFDSEATNVLKSFFPGLSLELDLQHVEIKEFFKAGDLHVTDNITEDRRRFDQMGSGAQRAIQIALIRYLAQVHSVNTANITRRLLLIDEPELYLHPQGIRRLRQALARLSVAGYQIILSTHSPLMLSRENAADTVIVLKSKEKGTYTRVPLRSAVSQVIEGAEAQARVFFELGNLAEIYFAERVILCEGETERRLFPLAYETAYGHSPDLDGIAFVSMGSCSSFLKALPVLNAMSIPACVVADLDFGFTHARSGNCAILPKDGLDMKAIKKILTRMSTEPGITLSPDGLPTSSKNGGLSASSIWAKVAIDKEGKEIVDTVHDELKRNRVWIWSKGCIEQVTKYDKKGEDAISEQERIIKSLTDIEFKVEMPDFFECLEWIRTM